MQNLQYAPGIRDLASLRAAQGSGVAISGVNGCDIRDTRSQIYSINSNSNTRIMSHGLALLCSEGVSADQIYLTLTFLLVD